MFADKMFWNLHSELGGYVPSFSPITNVSRLNQFRAYGACCALFVLRMAYAPPHLNKWVLLALMDPSFNPPFDLVRKHEPALASALEPWFSLGDHQDLSDGNKNSSLALRCLVTAVFGGGKTVRSPVVHRH